MWSVPKIVSQLFEPATFCGKVEIGLSPGWNFPVPRRNGGMQGEEEGKINALRPRRGIDWSLSSVRESRSSRRFRLGGAVIPLRTSRVNCRIKGKREKKKKKEKKRWQNIVDADASTRRTCIRCLCERLCSKLFWNLENLNRWKSHIHSFFLSLLPLCNRIDTERILNNWVEIWEIFILFDIPLFIIYLLSCVRCNFKKVL